mmetsp:Transcript_25352/g.62374  ORF Transcript_25352/g.62374 Transcript_25352/m.62374 type:complete len:214 (+) Transcript_25352:268-909(+)
MLQLGEPLLQLGQPLLQLGQPLLQLGGLIDLDGAVDDANEPEARDEANKAREAEEGVAQDRHVPEEDDVRRNLEELGNVHTREEVVRGIGEQIESRRPRGEVGAPPPVVVLRTQLEVAHNHGDLRARDDEDCEDKHHETEEVVEAVLPDGAEDEEQLHKDYAKRQHTPHHDRRNRTHVPDLLGDLARDGVCPDGGLDGLPAEPQEAAHEDEGQ